MVPFQTFLALLIFYLLAGCSQVAPPGAISKKTRSNSTVITNNNSGNVPTAQTQQNGSTPSGSHSNPAPADTTANQIWTLSPNVFLADGSTTDYVLNIANDDAKAMYDVLKVFPQKRQALMESKNARSAAVVKYSVKEGKDYACERNQFKQYRCYLKFSVVDGAVTHLHTLEELDIFTSDREMTENYPKSSVIAPLVQLNAKNNSGSINLSFQKLSQMLYEAMYTIPVTHPQYTNQTPNLTLNNRKGKNVLCTEDVSRATPFYTCSIYLYYDVAEIQKVL